MKRILPLMLLALWPCLARGAPADEIVWVPYTEPNGTTHQLYSRVCRPSSDQPARVVVIAHGTPPIASKRATMQPVYCGSEVARWFLARGYLVVSAMRTGYGQTGGPFLDSSRPCGAEDFERAGREAARQTAAVVDFATRLPGARPDGVIVVGQSVGGWAAIALDSMPHPKVAAIVSMAGGHGGHFGGRPNENCRPDQLAVAAGAFGASATTPMLWVYTENDSFFAPEIASAMYAAFGRAGGRAKFVQLGPFGADGHQLFLSRGGSVIWGPLMENYLAGRLGASP